MAGGMRNRQRQTDRQRQTGPEPSGGCPGEGWHHWHPASYRVSEEPASSVTWHQAVSRNPSAWGPGLSCGKCVWSSLLAGRRGAPSCGPVVLQAGSCGDRLAQRTAGFPSDGRTDYVRHPELEGLSRSLKLLQTLCQLPAEPQTGRRISSFLKFAVLRVFLETLTSGPLRGAGCGALPSDVSPEGGPPHCLATALSVPAAHPWGQSPPILRTIDCFSSASGAGAALSLWVRGMTGGVPGC